MKKDEGNMVTEVLRVAIVVLNWNGWQDTVECLESIFQINYKNISVVVVDNGSTDGSIEMIKEWAEGKRSTAGKYIKEKLTNKPISFEQVEAGTNKPVKEQLTLLKMKENAGYARGNNAGIRYVLNNSDCEYVLILNNDVSVKSDFITQMLDVFKLKPQISLVGPKILDYNTGKHIQGPLHKRIDIATLLLWYTPLSRLFIKTPILRQYLMKDIGPQKVYAITGCCMLFKRAVIERIGMFDVTTFLGWEEYIVAEKLLNLGYETYAVPDSILYHKLGQSTKKLESVEKTMAFVESEAYFQNKYLKMPKYKRWLLRLIRIVIYSIIALFNRSYRMQYLNLLSVIVKA